MSIKTFAASKVGIGLIAGLFGVTVGVSSASLTPAEPEVRTMTKEIPGPERIVTKEVKVEVTPQSCKDAIGYARDGFDLSSRSMSVVVDFLEATSTFDVDEMQSGPGRLQSLNAELRELTPLFQVTSGLCEAS